MTSVFEGASDMDDLSAQPWRDVPREEAQWIRPHLPKLADIMVEGVVRHVPEYARRDDPHYQEVVRVAVSRAMGHFVRMIADPDAPWQEVHQVFFDIGYGEAVEGATSNTSRAPCGSRPARRGATWPARPNGSASPATWRSR
ncbi:hypothetical protein ACFQHO_08340 [Actinomadura yumaensis]|uniref:hypothetical protein n=1 Tax=Actinomadura yumaensis TaxID=111807 RepID=UPI0036085B2B